MSKNQTNQGGQLNDDDDFPEPPKTLNQPHEVTYHDPQQFQGGVHTHPAPQPKKDAAPELLAKVQDCDSQKGNQGAQK